MATIGECRFLNRTLTIDDISKKPNCSNLKFKRAFQFLQLLLLQRVYGIDIVTPAPSRKPSKITPDEQEQEQKQSNYEVFLGGSCNPTTWRYDQAIPYFKSRSVSYYNPQVANWTPDLVEIEHRAKELAPLLFFVIDYDTRALASIVEVCYLAARGRSIIVVMTPMPEKDYTKFIQQKTDGNIKDDNDDYENVWEARRTLRALLQTINIPVFENVRLALERAAFILETTKHTIANRSGCDDNNNEEDGERDVLTPLPASSLDSNHHRSSVVVIRSLSNKTSFESPDEFYKQMDQSDIASCPSKSTQQCFAPTHDSNHNQSRLTSTTSDKRQLSCLTNESDDDGYCSLGSSNRTLSISSTSINSELFEATNDQQREENPPGSPTGSSNSLINNLVSNFYSYIPFVNSPARSDSSVSQAFLVLFTLPFRFIKNAILSPTSSAKSSSSSKETQFPLEETSHFAPSSPSSTARTLCYMFDLFIASGESDETWLKNTVMPTLKQINMTSTQRQLYYDNDQTEALYDMHIQKKSRVLYYLINKKERLSHLTAELSFVIGQRNHKVVVYLESTIDNDAEHILSPCERRDLQRSRKYLEDLALKEGVPLFSSLEQSWQKVLEMLTPQD